MAQENEFAGAGETGAKFHPALAAVGLGLEVFGSLRAKRDAKKRARKRRNLRALLISRQSQREVSQEVRVTGDALSQQAAGFGAAGVEAGLGVSADVAEFTTFQSRLRRAEILQNAREAIAGVSRTAREEIKSAKKTATGQIFGAAISTATGVAKQQGIIE